MEGSMLHAQFTHRVELDLLPTRSLQSRSRFVILEVKDQTQCDECCDQAALNGLGEEEVTCNLNIGEYQDEGSIENWALKDVQD